jgi:hypothetical protein
MWRMANGGLSRPPAALIKINPAFPLLHATFPFLAKLLFCFGNDNI